MSEADRVYATLRRQLLQWELPPGSLLGEMEISTRLGVSRTPVREALRRLERDQLVQIRPGRGAMASEISLHNVAQIFQMREAIETYAARLAARRGDAAVFAPLLEELTVAQGSLDTSRVADDGYVDYTALVSRFEGAIEAAAGNEYLSAALANVNAHTARLRHLARSNPERMVQAALEHVGICQAIVNRDSTLAAELTAEHIHSSLHGIVSVFVDDVTGGATLLGSPVKVDARPPVGTTRLRPAPPVGTG